MNLKTRLKSIERQVGPISGQESSAAVNRQNLRLQHLLFAEGMLHGAAWIKANPDADLMTFKMADLAGIEVPEPKPVDMSPSAFARDYEIMVTTIHEHYLQRYWAFGCTEKEMLRHFFDVSKMVTRERERTLLTHLGSKNTTDLNHGEDRDT